jgi:probable addiction module antidote protein
MTKKHPPSVSYQEDLLEDLKDHNEAVAYLNEALEESKVGDEESQELFLQALRNVAGAQGGVGAVAKKSHIRREILYRILSPRGNPELRTFTTLIHAMGLQLRFC